MQPHSVGRKIEALRTYAQDVSRAKGETSISTPVKPASVTPSPIENALKEEPAIKIDTNTPKAPMPQKAPRKLLSLKKQKEPIKETPVTKIVEPSQPTPVLNTKYAELTDEVAEVSDRVVKSSILSDDASIYDTELSGGTIIRDTKRKRFRLVPAMIEAVQGWFVSRKSTYEKKHEPYKVAKAESRKETIKAAIEQSQTAPTEDFATVVKRLKQVPRQKIESTLTFKKKADLPKPQWTHIQDESSTPVSQEDANTNEAEQTPPVTPSVAEVVTPSASLPADDIKEVTAQVETIHSSEEVAPQTQEVPPVPVEDAPSETEAIEEETVEVTIPNSPVPSPVSTPVLQYQTTTTRNVPRFPYAILAGVVLITTLLGIGTAYYFFGTDDDRITVAPERGQLTQPPQLLRTEVRESVRMEHREEFLEELTTRTAQRDTLTQLYPVTLENDQEVLADPLAVMTMLETHTQESFNRNIEALTFGTDGNAQPFLILEITNFDIAFSGILNWEKTMSADLYPLFGEIVTQTYDPTSRTSTQLTSAYFKDAIANNTIIRILLDENGLDRITYTFVDRDTILITTNRETLQSLLPHVQ